MCKLHTAIAVLTLSMLTTLAHAQVRASDICNMKRSQYERNQCLEYGLRGSMLRVKSNTQRLLDSNRVPDSEKDSLLKSHQKWASKLERKCSDNECYYDMTSERNNEIERIMAKYGIAPV